MQIIFELLFNVTRVDHWSGSEQGKLFLALWQYNTMENPRKAFFCEYYHPEFSNTDDT